MRYSDIIEGKLTRGDLLKDRQRLANFIKKYETENNLINIDRIQKICDLSDKDEKFYKLNYFFSNKKNNVEIICSNIDKVF